MSECEANCDPHKGRVRRVHVSDPATGHDWGEFWYCSEAVLEDERHGLIVLDTPESRWPNELHHHMNKLFAADSNP